MGLWLGDRQVVSLPGEGTPIAVDNVKINGFTLYVDGNGNFNILAPDNTTVVPLVLSGSGPPIPP